MFIETVVPAVAVLFDRIRLVWRGWGGVGGGFLAWSTMPYKVLTDIFWRNCIPPDSECGCQGVLNSMDIHHSVLDCIVTPRTAVKYGFPEDFAFKQNVN